MATSVRLIHPASGMTKKGYVGFSWTYMFFGWIVPIFRGEMLTALLHLIFSIFTVFIFHIVEMFLYNGQYMRRQLADGWQMDRSDPNFPYAAMKLGMMG